VWLGVLLVALLATRNASAADVAATYAEGVQLYQEGKYSEALPFFRGAYDASQSPNAHLFIARCLRELGDFPGAYQEMRRTVEEATKLAESDSKYAPTRDSAAAELALLEPRVAKVIVAIADAPRGTTVRINLRELPTAELGQPVAVAPGNVSLVVEAPGKMHVERSIDVAPGDTRTIALALEDAPTEGDDGTPDEARDEASGGEVRIAGYVVAGLGVVGIGAFAVLAATAKSDYDALDAECGGQPCPESERARIDDGRSLTMIANVTLALSAAVAAAGVAMIIFGGADTEEEARAAAARNVVIVPVVGPDAAGLWLQGRF
jgi:hypothetical protein